MKHYRVGLHANVVFCTSYQLEANSKAKAVAQAKQLWLETVSQLESKLPEGCFISFYEQGDQLQVDAEPADSDELVKH